MRFAYLAGLVCMAGALAAQEKPAALPSVMGEVTAADTPAKTLSLRNDKGDVLTVQLEDRTLYLRVPPGDKDLKRAARITHADITVGDRVLARGRMSEDHKSITAAAVIVMTKTDLAQKQQREREEWQKRGTAGTVAAVDPAAKQITVTVGAREAAKQVVVDASGKVDLMRYSPDSVKFSDARPSSLAEVAVGDHVRVLGDKSEDGARIAKPEQIVFGSFRTITGTVTSVDAAANEVRITDLDAKKPVLVKVNTDSTVRRLPAQMAMFLARRFNPGAFPNAGERPAQQRPPQAAGAPGGAPAGGAGGQRGGGGDLSQMLERLPPVAISELKQGDAIVVYSTKGADPGRVTAITLVAGVEPLITAAPRGQVGLAWSFGAPPE